MAKKGLSGNMNDNEDRTPLGVGDVETERYIQRYHEVSGAWWRTVMIVCITICLTGLFFIILFIPGTSLEKCRYLMERLVLNRALIEGIGLVIAGLGFLTFDLTRALGREESQPIEHIAELMFAATRGLVFVAMIFMGLGVASLLLDVNFGHGIVQIVAGIGLMMLVTAMEKDICRTIIISTLIVLCSFCALGVLFMLDKGITIHTISFIIFGVGLAIFQISEQTNRDLLMLVGGIMLWCGTIFLGGSYVIEGLTYLIIFILGTGVDSILYLPTYRTILEAVSLIVIGIGIVGIMLGLTFGGEKEKNRDMYQSLLANSKNSTVKHKMFSFLVRNCLVFTDVFNILRGVSPIIVGVGLIGLSAGDIVYFAETHQGARFTAFGMGLILGTCLALAVVCGVNLILLGIGILSNDFKRCGNNLFAAFFGYVSIVIMWFINKEFVLGVSSIFFIVTMMLPFLSNGQRNVIRIGFPLFIISSLFFTGILIYTGINRLF